MRSNAQFAAEDGTVLRGYVFGPEEPPAQSAPVIVMTHGFSGVLASLTHYAEHFEQAGFIVLLYDHRGFGASEGEPRQHIDPYQQVADFRDAITFAQGIPGVDPARVGIWGSSYAGGHVLVVGACDRRVKCVVSQIPFVSGHLNTPRLFTPDRVKLWQRRFVEERQALAGGAKPTMIPVFSADEHADDCVLPPTSERFIEASEADEGWLNLVTMRSLEFFTEYEPGGYAQFVSPTPLLMIVGARDTINPPDLSLAAFERALQPKKAHVHPGGHFGTYSLQFDEVSKAATDWFLQHLR